MHRVTSLLIATCLAGLTSLGAGVHGAAASADGVPMTTDALELSLDGVTWAADITAPLFDPAITWVPGDTRVETFFVRSKMPDAGALQVVIERAALDDLLDTGALKLAARAGDGDWTSIESGGRHVLVDNDRLGGGRAVAVQVHAAFKFSAPSDTMILTSDLDFSVVLSDATAVLDQGESDGGNGGNSGGDGDGGSSDGGGAAGEDAGNDPIPGAAGLLPGTGSEIRPWLTPLALLLLTGGAILIVRRRSDEDGVSRV